MLLMLLFVESTSHDGCEIPHAQHYACTCPGFIAADAVRELTSLTDSVCQASLDKGLHDLHYVDSSLVRCRSVFLDGRTSP